MRMRRRNSSSPEECPHQRLKRECILMKPPPESVLQQIRYEPAALLASIVECSDDAIFGLALDGTVLSWNRAAEEMYGYTAEKMMGKSAIVIVPRERAGEVETDLAKLRRQEKIPHYQTVRLTKDHGRVHVSVRVSPIKNSSGEITGAAIIARDITGQKRVLEALEVASGIKQQ